MFQAVGKGLEVGVLSVFFLQRPLQEVVANGRIFWQQRAVEIGGDHVFVENAFVSGFFRVSIPVEDSAQGAMIADIGPASVVFKARNRLWA